MDTCTFTQDNRICVDPLHECPRCKDKKEIYCKFHHELLCHRNFIMTFKELEQSMKGTGKIIPKTQKIEHVPEN